MGWRNPATRGIMGVNCSVRTADVMGDGHEQHDSAGRGPGGNHLVRLPRHWAMGGAGADGPVRRRLGRHGQRSRTQLPAAEFRQHAELLHATGSFRPGRLLAQMGMPCTTGNNTRRRSAACTRAGAIYAWPTAASAGSVTSSITPCPAKTQDNPCHHVYVRLGNHRHAQLHGLGPAVRLRGRSADRADLW